MAMTWASRMDVQTEMVIHLVVMSASLKSKDDLRAAYLACSTSKGSSTVEHLAEKRVVTLASQKLMDFQMAGYWVQC